jgi:hypothetical protein
MLEELRSELGYREGRGNANKFSADLGRPGEPWCQDFVQVIAKRAGTSGVPDTAATFVAAADYIRRGRWSKTPQVGAQFFVYINMMGRIAHTGVVVGISDDGGTVYTIEGNTNVAGGREGVGVFRRARPARKLPGRSGIVGYGLPTYGAPEPGHAAAPPTKKPTKDTAVFLLQKAVRATPDGAWGPHTDAALMIVRMAATGKKLTRAKTLALQASVGTKPDGAIGPKTRAAVVRATQLIQKALRVSPDGDWGPKTDLAFTKARVRYRR